MFLFLVVYRMYHYIYAFRIVLRIMLRQSLLQILTVRRGSVRPSLLQ